MSVDDRAEWLMVASEAVEHIPAGLLAEACKQAAKVCGHPAKVIPAVCAYADENRSDWEWRNRPATQAPRLAMVPKPATPPAKPMTQAEVDATPAHMVGLGLACGAIIRDTDGNLRPGEITTHDAN